MGRGYRDPFRPSLALFWSGDAWFRLFGKSREALISYFRELTANPWEHVFFKYMFQTYKGPIQIDAPSKVIAMLQSMSSNGYQKRIIMTKKLFFPVDRPKLARRFFRLLFSRNLACFANPPLPPPEAGGTAGQGSGGTLAGGGPHPTLECCIRTLLSKPS